MKVLKRSPDIESQGLLNKVKLGREEYFKGFYYIHVWAWWPFRSSDMKQNVIIWFYLMNTYIKFEFNQPSSVCEKDMFETLVLFSMSVKRWYKQYLQTRKKKSHLNVGELSD